MNRRLFFRLPLVAASLVAAQSAIATAFAQVAGALRQKVWVKAGEDRDNKPFKFLGADFQVKVSGKDNDGRLVIFDTVRPEKKGPPLHLHIDCDEWFFVRDGEFKAQAGDEIVRLKAGDSLFIPRNLPHTFVKTSEGVAHMIVMHQPAGTMEEYFRTASQFADPAQAFTPEIMARHNMRTVGPPLSPD
jgi:mannose-6-phosphate isomerase-like protein (cupin superfamily)